MGKPKRGLSGPESSGGGSGAQKGSKCIQNDLLGLKMVRNGAGNGQNGSETTKCAKNGEKTAENEGRTTDGTNGTNGGGRRAENGGETTKCAKNAKFWGGRGKNEAQRGLKIGARFQIGGVGRGCIPGGLWGGTARRPRRGGLQPIRRPKIGQNGLKTGGATANGRKWTQMWGETGIFSRKTGGDGG